jgi:hypothetical protein
MDRIWALNPIATSGHTSPVESRVSRTPKPGRIPYSQFTWDYGANEGISNPESPLVEEVDGPSFSNNVWYPAAKKGPKLDG